MRFHQRVVFAVTLVSFITVLLHGQSGEPKEGSAEVLRTFKTIYVQSKTPLANCRCWPASFRRATTSTNGTSQLPATSHEPRS